MILVTGAGGKTGLAVLRGLNARGLEARGLVHRPEQEEAVRQTGAREVVIGDLTIPNSVQHAFEGIDAVYFICPNVHPLESEIGTAVIELAQEAAVPRFVYHSVLFPHIESMPHHWQKMRVEAALTQSDLDFTVLQPATYMQNILSFWPNISETGHYALPYSPDTVFSPVDLNDIGEAAAKVLEEVGHSNATYALAGPELLSSREMTYQISQVLGREVVLEQVSVTAWEKSARASGLNQYAVETLCSMFAFYDRHGLAGNAKSLELILGRMPSRFLDFLHAST